MYKQMIEEGYQMRDSSDVGGSGAADQVPAEGTAMEEEEVEEVDAKVEIVHPENMRHLASYWNMDLGQSANRICFGADMSHKLLKEIGPGPAPFTDGLHLDGGAFTPQQAMDYAPLLAPRSAFFTRRADGVYLLNIAIMDVQWDRSAQIPWGSTFSQSKKGAFMVDKAPVELGAGVAPPGFKKERRQRGPGGAYDDRYIDKDGSTVRSCSEAWRVWQKEMAPHCSLEVSCARDALYHGHSIVARFTRWQDVPRDYFDYTCEDTYIFLPRFAGRD